MVNRTAVAAPLKSSARIVVIGAGAGGLAVANRLRRALDGAAITIIDAKAEHNYQPGYTLVAIGVWPEARVRGKNADYLSQGIDWVQEMAVEIDAEAKSVMTVSGARIRYDFLVVAPGLELDYGAIEGMDVSAIGTNGLASVYAGPEGARRTWHALDDFRKLGGTALLTLPGGPLKCAGAPLKMTYMVRDLLLRARNLEKSQVRFMSSLATGTIFGVKTVNDHVLRRWEELGIQVDYNKALVGVDIGARRARFSSPDGTQEERPYDLLHVAPPMRAPAAVRHSSLAWRDGVYASAGWLEVDPHTLQHRRHYEIFGIGDVNGTPRGKTAATVKKSAPIVAENLLSVIDGKSPGATFDGYTSCPLVVREGAAMLIEFDYAGKLTPSLPFVEPLQESYLAWIIEDYLLKPAYTAMLKGRG